jgi:hypothetical protein
VQREYFPLLAPWFLKRYARELEHLIREPAAFYEGDVVKPSASDDAGGD